MYRRKLLASAGAGIGALGLGLVTTRRYGSVPNEVTIWIYEASTLQPFIEENFSFNISHYKSVIKKQVSQVLGSAFSPSFTVKFHSKPVTVEDDFNETIRNEGLIRWMNNSTVEKKSAHSNILLATAPQKQFSKGVGTFGLIPGCSKIDRHGVVWIPESANPLSLMRLLCHEIGHNLGLLHSHGGIIEPDGLSLMMTPDFMDSYPRNLFGEPLPDSSGQRIMKFNDSLGDEHITL